MTSDERYMHQCLDLAAGGYGWVHPNPMVGAVLVRKGQVLATGFHKKFGGPHAEQDCLRKAGDAARGSTLYVNLEPCIHHGKTPPCVDAIIRAGVREVVVAMKDPNPLVAGRGLAALRKAGIVVRTGTMRREAAALNERFTWWHTMGIPYVGLKWAQSLDGFVADTSGRSKWITGEDARRYAHYLRSGYDGLLVGAGTVIADDPRLTVRHLSGRDPVRIVLDGALRVTGNEKVFRHRTGRTILLTSTAKVRSAGPVVMRLLAHGIDIVGIDGRPPFPPRQVLKVLAAEGIASLLVEGGPRTLGRFFNERAFNMYHAFVRASLLGGGKTALGTRRDVGMRSLERTKGRNVLLFRNGDMLVEGGPA